MKSSIKIDFADNGKGLQPFIKVVLESSDDPRDKLLQTFFQSLGRDSNWLSVNFDGYTGGGNQSAPLTSYISIYALSPKELKETVDVISNRIDPNIEWNGAPPNNNPAYVSTNEPQ
jgi:hypothetical protein